MKSTKNIIESNRNKLPENIHQGDCVHLKNQEELFQVLGIDNSYEKCWVREWPLNPNGSPVFEISIKQVSSNQINRQ
tara:strand:+ start:340 stop:570 length:231 start_codon:yes stop_codon:yes gene_type:complete